MGKNEGSFEAFCRADYKDVYKACLAFCGDPDTASDATQDAFVKAYVRWRRLQDKDWRRGWVMTTAFNLCRKERRRNARKTSVGPPADSSIVIATDDSLLAAVASLPTRQAQTVLLHYYADYSVEVVADLLDISSGAVKSHLFRARKALQQHLQQEGAHP